MTQRLAGNGGFARSLLSILMGLFLAGVLMQVSGYDAPAAYSALGTGATGLRIKLESEAGKSDIAVSPSFLFMPAEKRARRKKPEPACIYLNQFTLAQSLAKVTPLLLTGLAIALALRAGMFNIGAQAPMLLGGLMAAVIGGLGAVAGGKAGASVGGLSPAVHVPLTLLAGILMGALWGALPGLLKAWRGVHEVLTTIMLNYVAANVAIYLTTHNLKDPKSMAAQTPMMAKSAWLSPLIPGSNLTVGLFLALLAAALLAIVIHRTALGFRIRAVGQGAEAARAAGIPVSRTMITAMALSGALCGLAGAIEVMGVHHRYVQGVAGNYGFDGIAVALLGGLNSGGISLSALFFGALANGAAYMQLQTNVPDSIGVIVQAVVILFVALRFRPKRKPQPLLKPEAEQ